MSAYGRRLRSCGDLRIVEVLFVLSPLHCFRKIGQRKAFRESVSVVVLHFHELRRIFRVRRYGRRFSEPCKQADHALHFLFGSFALIYGRSFVFYALRAKHFVPVFERDRVAVARIVQAQNKTSVRRHRSLQNVSCIVFVKGEMFDLFRLRRHGRIRRSAAVGRQTVIPDKRPVKSFQIIFRRVGSRPCRIFCRQADRSFQCVILADALIAVVPAFKIVSALCGDVFLRVQNTRRCAVPYVRQHRIRFPVVLFQRDRERIAQIPDLHDRTAVALNVCLRHCLRRKAFIIFRRRSRLRVRRACQRFPFLFCKGIARQILLQMHDRVLRIRIRREFCPDFRVLADPSFRIERNCQVLIRKPSAKRVSCLDGIGRKFDLLPRFRLYGRIAHSVKSDADTLAPASGDPQAERQQSDDRQKNKFLFHDSSLFSYIFSFCGVLPERRRRIFLFYAAGTNSALSK